jgi:hypothetical protein
MTKLDQISQLPVENTDPLPPYGFSMKNPGALKHFVEGEQFLAANGLQGEAMWKGILSVFANRLAGYTTDSGVALQQEFSLPASEKLTNIKWNIASERGTKMAVFDSMHQLGHNMVSIYNSSGRTDSPYFNLGWNYPAVKEAAPTSIADRYNDSTNFPQLFNSHFSSSWYTVVVWDCSDGDSSAGSSPMTLLGGATLSASRLGNSKSSSFAYTGEKEQFILKECAKLGCGLTGAALEIMFVYRNHDTERQSRINSYGRPMESGLDIIEYAFIDVAETINSTT